MLGNDGALSEVSVGGSGDEKIVEGTSAPTEPISENPEPAEDQNQEIQAPVEAATSEILEPPVHKVIVISEENQESSEEPGQLFKDVPTIQQEEGKPTEELEVGTSITPEEPLKHQQQFRSEGGAEDKNHELSERDTPTEEDEEEKLEKDLEEMMVENLEEKMEDTLVERVVEMQEEKMEVTQEEKQEEKLEVTQEEKLKEMQEEKMVEKLEKKLMEKLEVTEEDKLKEMQEEKTSQEENRREPHLETPDEGERRSVDSTPVTINEDQQEEDGELRGDQEPSEAPQGLPDPEKDSGSMDMSLSISNFLSRSKEGSASIQVNGTSTHVSVIACVRRTHGSPPAGLTTHEEDTEEDQEVHGGWSGGQCHHLQDHHRPRHQER